MGIRMATVGLIVNEMAKSLAFYRQLGLDIPQEADGEEHVQYEGEGLGLAWDTVTIIKQADPLWNGQAGRVAVAFQCDSPEQVNATYKKLAELGYGHNEPWDAFWGQRYARLRDPDGNRVELFAELSS